MGFCHQIIQYYNYRGLLTVSMAFDLLASCVSRSLSRQLPLLFFSLCRIGPTFPSKSGLLLCITLSSSGFPRILWIPPLYTQAKGKDSTETLFMKTGNGYNYTKYCGITSDKGHLSILVPIPIIPVHFNL